MKITIYGAGGWGTALACLLYSNGHKISLWSFEPEHVIDLLKDRENKLFLPGIKLPSQLIISNDYSLGKDADLVILAVPSKAVRNVVLAAAPYIKFDAMIINVAKGFSPDNQKLLSEVIREILPNHSILTLSGPSHAEEVAKNLSTTVVIAGKDINQLHKAQDIFMCDTFRVYPNTDQIGVEVGGAVKNVIGLGAGVADGLRQGDNAKAALITRGLAEIKRLGIAMGAKPATFSGLAGMGDLIVTCNSKHSRNYRAGLEIGKGKTLDKILSGTSMVIEGVYATEATYKLAQRYHIEMPITEQIFKMLYENRSPREAMKQLMTRAKSITE